MPTPTYDLIASNILSTSAASVTFSSISGSYRDLILVIELANGVDGRNTRIQFNSDTGSNYSRVYTQGNGSTTLAAYETTTSFRINNSGQDDSVFLVQILDYSATNKHKTLLARYNQATGSFPAVGMSAGRWANTSAITTILLNMNADNFPSGSSFYLYGIVS